jgi:exoribonuclease II
MIKHDELLVMRAIALCFKPYLKPEEAMIYCNLGRTQMAKKFEEFGIYKNNSGYYKKEDIDRMLAGELTPFLEAARKLKL